MSPTQFWAICDGCDLGPRLQNKHNFWLGRLRGERTMYTSSLHNGDKLVASVIFDYYAPNDGLRWKVRPTEADFAVIASQGYHDEPARVLEYM